METFVLVVSILYTIKAVANFMVGSFRCSLTILVQACVALGMAWWGWTLL